MTYKLNTQRSSLEWNILWLALIAVLESLQFIILFGFVLTFFPANQSFKEQLLPEYIKLFLPEPDLLLYRTFVVAAFVFQMAGLIIFRKKLPQPELTRPLRLFLASETVALAIQLIVILKIGIYGNPPILKLLFYFSLLAGLLSKIFWSKWPAMIAKLKTPPEDKLLNTAGCIIDIIAPLFIWAATYIPNIPGAISQIYKAESFYHFDSFVAGPAWASAKGLLPGIDFYSQYGVGMPFLIGKLAGIGGFSHENVLRVLLLINGIYFTMCYVLLRLTTKNIFISAFGILLMLKLQFYSAENSTLFIWNHPSTTVVRYFFDVFFFFFLWLYTNRQRTAYLLLAATTVGISMFYATDSGLYLLITFYAYLGLLFLGRLILRSKLGLKAILPNLLLPPAAAFLILWFFYKDGPSLGFLSGMTEYINFTFTGYGALPYFASLGSQEFLSFFLANMIILTYVLTLILVISLILFRKIEIANLFIAAVSIYGLCLYHYYVYRTGGLSYRSLTVPFVIIVCFAIHSLVLKVSPVTRKRILVWLPVAGMIALFTNNSFIKYPNVFNLLRYDFTNDVATMKADFAIEDDVALIQRFIPKEKKVALISSFDVWILMKADRKPFLYYFPLLNSVALGQATFGGLKTDTKPRFLKIVSQLEEKPQYIFIEKKIYNHEIRDIFYKLHPWFNLILSYLNQNYEPAGQGHYLMVLRKK